MRSPELAVTDMNDNEKPLHYFEAREMEAEYGISLATKACDALHRYALDKSTIGLTEFYSDIAETTYSLVQKGMKPADAALEIMEPIRNSIQGMMHKRQYEFQNEDIFAYLGSAFERGITSTVSWLTKKFEEDLPDNQTRQIYTNGNFDTHYSVDIIEAVWNISPGDRELSLEGVSLVQNKTRTKLNELERRKILNGHMEFLRQHRLSLAKLQSVEATKDQIRDLETKLEPEVALDLELAFEEALTGSESEALASFTTSLQAFQEKVQRCEAYMYASKPVKRAYVGNLGYSNMTGSTDELTNRLLNALNNWKVAWVNNIGDKIKRVKTPVKPLITRSVISFADQDDEVTMLSDLTNSNI